MQPCHGGPDAAHCYRPLRESSYLQDAPSDLGCGEDELAAEATCEDEESLESPSSDSDSEPGEHKLHSELQRMLQEEKERVEQDLRERGVFGRNVPFSVALSGGGIRATAFQSGVLWRLAEEGVLKDVERISAVSGGSWAAMGFASHVVRAGRPEAGADLKAWYLRAVAKSIERMVQNVPYLARDLTYRPFRMPRDGSSVLPRVFDLPILIATLFVSLLLRPLCHVALYVVPTVELVDIFFGAEMREMFCWTSNWAEHWDRWPLVRLCRLPTYVFLSASASAFLFRALGMCKPLCKPGSSRWLFAQGAISVLARLAAGMVCLTVMVGLTSFLQTWAYTTKGVRREVCQEYVLNISQQLQCHDQPLLLNQTWYHQTRYRSYYKEDGVLANMTIIPRWGHVLPEYGAAIAWNTALTAMHGPTVMKSLVDSLLPAYLATLSCLLLLTLVCVPFYPGNFLQMLNVAGPLLVLSIVCSAVQWRVFGPVTGQHFLSFVELPFDNETWHRLYSGSLLAAMLILPFYYYVRGNAHRFYRRSLRLAFFAEGRHVTWGDLQDSHFCPIVILSATVTDYIIPGDKLPINPISFTPLHLGGSTLGFVRMKSQSTVAKAMAMSGAAPDAVVLARSQQLRSRFWLEVLGIGVGQHIQFDTLKNRRKLPLLWLRRRRPEQAERKELPDICYRLPSVLIFELCYALLLVSEMVIHRMQYCRAGRIVFYAGVVLAALMVTLSFFAFVPRLDFLLHSALIRTIHQVTGYYHKGRSPPSLLYVTDGMVEDNTGVMDLLRRQCERILLVYAGGDAKDEFKFLRKVTEGAATARLASLYDLEDPRSDVGEAVDRYRERSGKRLLVLGILYGWGLPMHQRKVGRLVIVKIHLPYPDLPVQPLLTEAEICGDAGNSSQEETEEPRSGCPRRARDLSGCCCDCCHRSRIRCGSMFPFPPTGVQFLTPTVTSSLVRLGHSVSEGVVQALQGPRPCL